MHDLPRLIEPCSGRVGITLQMQNGERIDTTALSTGFWMQNGEIKLNSWIKIPDSIEDREKEIAFLISGCGKRLSSSPRRVGPLAR